MRKNKLAVISRKGLNENEKYYYGELQKKGDSDKFEPHGDGIEFLWPSIFPKYDSYESLKSCLSFIKERPVYWG